MTNVSAGGDGGKNFSSIVQPDPAAHWIYIILLTVIALCGIVLNFGLLMIIRTCDKKEKRRNVLIANTAMADLLLVLSFPLDIWYSCNVGDSGWLCAIYQTIKLLPVMVVVTSLALMSVERLYIVSKLLTPSPNITCKYQLSGAVLSWIVFILITMINLLLDNDPPCNFNIGTVSVFVFAFVIEFVLILISFVTSIIFMRRFRLRHQREDDRIRLKRIKTRMFKSKVHVISCQEKSNLVHKQGQSTSGMSSNPSTSVSTGSSDDRGIFVIGNSMSKCQMDHFSPSCSEYYNKTEGTNQTTEHRHTGVRFINRLDLVTRKIITRTGFFVVAFLTSYSPPFIMTVVLAQIKIAYPYVTYSFWLISIILYLHVAMYPFIALYTDDSWRRKIADKMSRINRNWRNS